VTEGPGSAARPPAGDRLGITLLLCLVAIVGVLSMPALRYDGDAIAWEMEAESLVQDGRWRIRPAVAELQKPGAPYFVFNAETGYFYSKYGIGNTIVYAIPLLFERLVLGVEAATPPESAFGKDTAPFRITRRLLLFNFFQIGMSLLLALVLHRLAGLYTSRASLQIGFVLACFYSTYLWNYLRAPSSQIYQCLFFSLAILFLLRFQRRCAALPESRAPALGDSRELLWSALALCALCLVKTAFLPLWAVFSVAVVSIGWRGRGGALGHTLAQLRRNTATYLLFAAIPVLVLLALLLFTNHVKFGGAFEAGYAKEGSVFSGNPAIAIPAYLYHPRYSIFLHFPLLLLALFGVPAFWRRHRYDLLVWTAMFLVMFGVYASYQYWKGEAAFGPRYLLFALPVLALPSIAAFEWILEQRGALRRGLPSAAVVLVLALSTVAQLKVNALEFHVFFRMRALFLPSAPNDRVIRAYFRDTNTAVANAHFLAYRAGGARPPPLARLAGTMPREDFERFEGSVRAHLGSNCYFW
jgi:hypothetical protein